MTQADTVQNPIAQPAELPAALRVGIHRDEAIWKLEIMSRRGRLPGFRRTIQGCEVAAHGNPFDKVMVLQASDSVGKGAVFAPQLRLERKAPTITAILFVLTVWPGVLLTDSFMRMHLDFYDAWTTNGLKTWWWYIPLTVLSLAWAWAAAMKKSHRTALVSAKEALAKIAAELDGTLHSDPPAA